MPANHPPTPLSTARRALYLAGGWVCLALAFAGIIFPVLPTTPFVLLASFFFVRCSPRMQQKLEQSRWFGPFLQDWRRHRGIRLHVKIKAVVMVLLVMAATLYFANNSPLVQGLSIGLTLIGLIVVLRLPTISHDSSWPRSDQTKKTSVFNDLGTDSVDESDESRENRT
ncbi:MAG: YbaN family protein [Planctomycetota bacterium]|nr:YbaN family protein [Planctomycetota bacterium]